MTAGESARHVNRPEPPRSHNQTSRQYFKHSAAQRVNTDAVIVDSLRAQYPELHLTVVPGYNCDLLAFGASGHAGLAPVDNEKDRANWRVFLPPFRRLDGGRGALITKVQFGKFLLDWQGKEYILYVVDGLDGVDVFGHIVCQYILSPSVEATNRLLMEAGNWHNQLHREVWVYDNGYWQKSFELYESVQKSNWDDVILDKDMKKSMIEDVETFFDSRDKYERLGVPWKRGVIYYGPPGNGKTISIKAMMHTLYKRKPEIPTLYVKSLKNIFYEGPEFAINQIFSLARREAPCYLVFEDLDSVVTDEVRSYFLVSLGQFAF